MRGGVRWYRQRMKLQSWQRGAEADGGGRGPGYRHRSALTSWFVCFLSFSA